MMLLRHFNNEVTTSCYLSPRKDENDPKFLFADDKKLSQSSKMPFKCFRRLFNVFGEFRHNFFYNPRYRQLRNSPFIAFPSYSIHRSHYKAPRERFGTISMRKCVCRSHFASQLFETAFGGSRVSKSFSSRLKRNRFGVGVGCGT